MSVSPAAGEKMLVLDQLEVLAMGLGHQVNFVVLPADLPEIEEAIRSAGEMCIFQDRTPTSTPVVLYTLAFGPGRDGPAAVPRLHSP